MKSLLHKSRKLDSAQSVGDSQKACAKLIHVLARKQTKVSKKGALEKVGDGVSRARRGFSGYTPIISFAKS